MGLRTRILARLRRVFGGAPPSPAPTAAPPAPAAAPAARPAPPSPAPAAASPAPAAAPPAPAAPPAAAPRPGAPALDPEAAEKAARHLAKTRAGLLRWLDTQGGRASLGDLHDHSERRYFIGHKKFSDLMESLVADAVVDYDAAEGSVTLTEAGRSAIAAP